MALAVTVDKTCPKCDSKDYRFRGRRPVEANENKGLPAGIETKYQCASCGHAWKVRLAAAGD